MARQRIVRRKIIITAPYTDLDSGFKAKQLLTDIEKKTPAEWEALTKHPGVEIDFGKVEETGREIE